MKFILEEEAVVVYGVQQRVRRVVWVEVVGVAEEGTAIIQHQVKKVQQIQVVVVAVAVIINQSVEKVVRES